MLLQIHRILSLGVKNLFLHKVRSVLTMLGIVFGVSSVIAMLAVGEGAALKARQEITRLGSRNIILDSVEPPQNAASQQTQSSAAGRRKYGLTEMDRTRIARTLPHVLIVHPESTRTDEVTSATSQHMATLIATGADLPEVRQIECEQGRFFTDLEVLRVAPVCVLSPSLSRKLIPFGEVIGKAVRIEADYYTVIGISRKAGQYHDDVPATGKAEITRNLVYLPVTTARARVSDFTFGRTQFDTLVVHVDDSSHVPEVARNVESILLSLHREKDYKMTVPLELLAQARRTQRLFNVIIGSIAAISLLVGGIGIMNIMLATVTERTREIGIRRALGAKRRDIIWQFLAETTVISLTGGLIGILLGMVIPGLISTLTKIPTVVTTGSVVLSVGISLLIGIAFGIYPARRAASLDPIEALRH
ncbi:MAG: ABC transporter permease [Akkermansiaceae bacterium]|nr:ABC transporter permease [Akkermansiaceae bacterium]MCF7731367.1 ABC transporter permease [Akkermansiaceae bacterium]